MFFYLCVSTDKDSALGSSLTEGTNRMIQRILFSVFFLLLVLLPRGSTECTMDDFLRCDREIQSKQSPNELYAQLKEVH